MPNGERVAKRDRVIITSEFILPFEHACISANFKYSTLVFVLNLVFARQIHSHFVDKFKHRLQVICIEMSSAHDLIGFCLFWCVENLVLGSHLEFDWSKAFESTSNDILSYTSEAMTDALPMEISQKFR